MPADLWTDAARMATCGLTVAAVAAPVGLLAWAVARRTGVPVLPRPKSWRVPWTGFEVLVGFFVLNLVFPPVVFVGLEKVGFFQQVYGPDFPPSSDSPPAAELEASAAAGVPAVVAAKEQRAELVTVRNLWAGVLSLPVQLGFLLFARSTLYPGWRSPADARTIPARVALGVAGWAVLTPIVLVIHAAVNLAFTYLEWPPEDHPLSKLSAARPAIDRVLFFVQAGVAAPLVEELVFRGLLLGWLVGGRSLGPRPSLNARVWSVLAIGVVMAVLTAHKPGELLEVFTRGPVLFAAFLAAGWAAVRCLCRRKRRTVGAVYASAALFAVVHSAVWPTPIPLFALGLGLGWLAVRTRGILAPAVVHGLFNAVSVLFVLRSG